MHAASSAEVADAALGSAEYVPSPARPFGWRGDGSGCFPGATPPTHWSATSHVRWSATVGASYSSPIITEKLAIVTAEPNFVIAIIRADGRLVWRVVVTPGDLSDPKDRARAGAYLPPKAGSGMAAATPLTDGRNIYLALANGIICALDLNGKIQWSAFIEARQSTGYGRSASPILVAGKLIIHMTNLYALDPANGKQLWVNTKCPSSYGTPVPFKSGGLDLIATPQGTVVGADDGKSVAEDIAHSGAPSPVARDGIIYYGDVAVSAIRLDSAFKDQEVWSAMIPDEVFGSPILHDNDLFIVTGKGILFTFDAGGKGKGEREPLSKPQHLFGEDDDDSGAPAAFASLTLAGKYLFLNSNSGEVVVLEATREARPVSRNRLPKGSGASPVFSGNEMFLRSGDKLMCISE